MEFTVDYHVTHAMIRAGYSAKSAHVQGSVLLRDPRIQARIRAEEEAQLWQIGLTATRVKRALADIAFADRLAIFDEETGALLPPRQWPRGTRAAVRSLRVSTTPDGERIADVQFEPATPAVRTLGEYFRLSNHAAAPAEDAMRVLTTWLEASFEDRRQAGIIQVPALRLPQAEPAADPKPVGRASTVDATKGGREDS